MAEFEKLESGKAKQFTIVSSADFDSAPSFAFFNTAGTLVQSMTATQSGSTAYFAFPTLPSSIGFYHYEWLYGVESYEQIVRGVFEVVTTMVEEADLYCHANDVRNLYKPLSKGELRNNEIDEFIQDIMNEVNAKLGKSYSVPFVTGVDSFPPLIETITKHLTLIEILERKGGVAIPEWISKREERYRGMLDSIADGEIYLTLSGGTVLTPAEAAGISQVDHSMENYVPTFNLLHPEDQRIDPDRTEDEEDAL